MQQQYRQSKSREKRYWDRETRKSFPLNLFYSLFVYNYVEFLRSFSTRFKNSLHVCIEFIVFSSSLFANGKFDAMTKRWTASTWTVNSKKKKTKFDRKRKTQHRRVFGIIVYLVSLQTKKFIYKICSYTRLHQFHLGWENRKQNKNKTK